MGENAIIGKSFCLTGIPKSDRALLWAFIVDCGGRWITGVTGTLDVLVVGPTAGPSKLKKATALGIEMWTPEQLETAIRTALDYPQGSLMARGWRLPIKQTKESVRSTVGVWAGRVFCITGITKNARADLAQAIESFGGTCVTSVSKRLSALIAGDEPGPTKMANAAAWGLEVWSEERLLEELDKADKQRKM